MPTDAKPQTAISDEFRWNWDDVVPERLTEAEALTCLDELTPLKDRNSIARWIANEVITALLRESGCERAAAAFDALQEMILEVEGGLLFGPRPGDRVEIRSDRQTEVAVVGSVKSTSGRRVDETATIAFSDRPDEVLRLDDCLVSRLRLKYRDTLFTIERKVTS